MLPIKNSRKAEAVHQCPAVHQAVTLLSHRTWGQLGCLWEDGWGPWMGWSRPWGLPGAHPPWPLALQPARDLLIPQRGRDWAPAQAMAMGNLLVPGREVNVCSLQPPVELWGESQTLLPTARVNPTEDKSTGSCCRFSLIPFLSYDMALTLDFTFDFQRWILRE